MKKLTSKSKIVINKSAIHYLYEDIIRDGLKEEYKEKCRKCFYFSEWERLLVEGTEAITDKLQGIVENSYISKRNIDGLMAMGYINTEAENIINDYSDKIEVKYDNLWIDYSKEIKDIKKKHEVWFSYIDVNEEGTHYKIDGKPFIDEVAVSTTGNKIYIKAKDFIYTSTFSQFLNGDYGLLSSTGIEEISMALRYRKKQWKNELAGYLFWVVGKRKANQLVGRAKNIKIDVMPVLSLGYLETDRAKGLFFPGHLSHIKVSKGTKSKLKKEIRKLVYQIYKKEISEVFMDINLDKGIDYDLLIKYDIIK